VSGQVPQAIAAYSILTKRVPDLQWELGRVFEAAADYAELDVVAIAQATADYAATHRRVKDGPKLFRTFLENARKASPAPADDEQRLSPYDRRRNR
jgi:hypothetical protein